MILAGQRPLTGRASPSFPSPLFDSFHVLPPAAFPPQPVCFSASTRHPSTLIAPVPCLSTFCATVPISDLRPKQIGSSAGFSAAPHPFHISQSVGPASCLD